MDHDAGSLEKLLELAAKDEATGLGDAPWPPHFRKTAGEAPRVAPSRARSAAKKPSGTATKPAARKTRTRGFFAVQAGLGQAIARGLAYAPYADMIWCETSEPNLEEAGQFAHAIHAQYPGKLLAYNCSPSFNWKKKLDEHTIAKFQKELALMGYRFQFITLAGFHVLNLGMFELAERYRETGMTAYARLQEIEFEREADSGYRGVKHQAFVGTGYFDAIAQAITGGTSSTTALTGSTEEEQFNAAVNYPAAAFGRG
jgi:isocitrate lyase